MRSITAVLLMLCGVTSVAGAQDSAAGAKIFADQKCSLCHSIGGKGNAKGIAGRGGHYACAGRHPRVD